MDDHLTHPNDRPIQTRPLFIELESPMFPPLFKVPFFPSHFPAQQPREQTVPSPYPLSDSAIPIGSIIIFPGEILQQSGQLSLAMTDLRYMPWMICDGSSLLIAEYPDLYRVIGGLYGSTGKDCFNLPDYRGYFLRGVDLQKKIDQDQRQPPAGKSVNPQGIGSTQRDAMRQHQHLLQMTANPVPSVAEGTQPLETPTSQSNTGNIVQNGNVGVSDTETRSVNISVNWLIRTQ